MTYSKENRIEQAKKNGSKWVVGYVTPGSDTILWDYVRPDRMTSVEVGAFYKRGVVVHLVEVCQ